MQKSKRIVLLTAALCLILVPSLPIYAQGRDESGPTFGTNLPPQDDIFLSVFVAPGFGTLNAAVDGDTTSTGARRDSAILPTVYVLERDGVYVLDGSIENRFPLIIVAADGSGERPQLIPGVPTGGSSSRPFRVRGDITLRGLYITNEDQLGAALLRTIRVSADSVRVVLAAFGIS